jgi:signal transduction histidine kinase
MAAEGRLSLAGRIRARAGTVRVRTTAAAVVVVGVAMAMGAVVLVGVLRETLTREVRTAAQVRATDMAGVLQSGTQPAALGTDNAEDQVTQILDPAGRVLASSPNLHASQPVARLRPGQSATVEVPIDNDDFLAVATSADTPQGRRIVVVARALDSVGEATQIVSVLLAVGLPALLVVVAMTTWRVVGRALAPVEAIRTQVDAISAAQLHRRVPDPPGTDEIARLAQTMNRMLGRLEQAGARQRRFVSDASHELRSPVAAIRQHAEVALAHPDRTTTAELATAVLAEGLRVQRLVEDLLLLAGADEHTLWSPQRPVDLDDLVFDEARRLRGITDLRVDTTAVSAGRVDADIEGLRRVLANIGDNAARHARTLISFTLATTNQTVVLMVDDDGPGIPPGDRTRVLERFVRLDDARARDAGGSGLGLAITAELIAAHNGTISITQSPLGGARIHLTLPTMGIPPAPGPPTTVAQHTAGS